MRIDSKQQFEKQFGELTRPPGKEGLRPLSWQSRLFEQWVADDVCPVIDLPTGMGKTAVMAIWLIARSQNPKLGRRLIYVVDRRTVVDQATDLAERLNKNAIDAGLGYIAVSTLRGQLADNREWSTDPSRPAISIGTVDLIGSALLFSGYRSSYKRRPLEAGLLGQDSLLVLDEAHLSRPFKELACAIGRDGQFQKTGDGQLQGKPMRVVRMSATSGPSGGEKRFTLTFQDGRLAGDDKEDAIIAERFGARKRLTVEISANVVESIAWAASETAAKHPGSRLVIFVKSPKDVEAVRKALIKMDKSRARKIAQLTGTMRGLERDELVTPPEKDDQHERRVMQRFLTPENDPSADECFLISTSAGEVGFDLNADHLIGDAAPLDSWIQRLGRVNRRGRGVAIVRVVVEHANEKEAKRANAGKNTIASASVEAINALKRLPRAEPLDVDDRAGPIFDASPSALRNLSKPDDALSPAPAMVDMTDILLDAWSMTSILKPMPGRPEVGPWLRGIDDELPQTTIAWRAELELLAEDPDPKPKFKAIFSTHRIRPHETLTAHSYRVLDFLQRATREKGGRPELKQTRIVIKLSHDLLVKTIGELLEQPAILNADPTLILPATFGGLDKGMLSHDAVSPAAGADTPLQNPLDVADIDGYESRDNVATRLRIVLERAADRWKLLPLPFGRPQSVQVSDALGIDVGPQHLNAITDKLRARGLRIRKTIKFDLDDEGDERKRLILLSGISKAAKRESQPLDEHVSAVEAEAKRIANCLQLEPCEQEALLFAARWHDLGKDTPTWQRFIGGREADGRPRGKSGKFCDPKRLAGYRHEFGSLLRVTHPDPTEPGAKPELPRDETIRDLALHLIAVHHGHGRPHFATPVDHDFHKPALIGEVHTDTVRRFARLQRHYGWWRLAWLENLLRCADAIASAQVNNDDYQDDNPEAGE